MHRIVLATLALMLLVSACGSGEDETIVEDLGSADTGAPTDEGKALDPGGTEKVDPGAQQEDPGTTPPTDPGVKTDPGEAQPDPGPAACDETRSAQIPPQSGVVYVAHYHSKDLRIYRTDGEKPRAGQVIDLGEYVHDMVLDAFTGHLFMAHDQAGRVDVYRVQRVTGPAAQVVDPVKLATISFAQDIPRFLAVDGLRERLFVLAYPPSAGGAPLTEVHLYTYDYADPMKPVRLGEDPVTLPTTLSLAVDPLAGILYFNTILDKTLFAYDVSVAPPAPRPGTALSLTEHYPQTSSTAFTARNLRLDPWRGRLYLARAQTALSEVIAFSYPPSVSATEDACPPRAGYDDLAKLDDFFDVDKEVDQRPNLLDAFTAIPDPRTGDVYLSASAWDGTRASAIVVALDEDLRIGPGCQDFGEGEERFGCFYRLHTDGQPGSHVLTEDASCLDHTNGVFVGTSVGLDPAADQGGMHFFRSTPSLGMEPWLPEDGSTLQAGVSPIVAVCH